MRLSTSASVYLSKPYRLNSFVRQLLIFTVLSALLIRFVEAQENFRLAPSELAYKNLLFYYEQRDYLESLVRASLQQGKTSHDTRLADSQMLLTRAYMQLELLDDAENSLQIAEKIGISPQNNNELRLTLAEHYAGQQNLSALKVSLQKLTAPLSAQQKIRKNFLLATYFFTQAHYADSSLAFAHISANDPSVPYIRYNLAMSQLKDNKPQHAEETLTRLLTQLDKQTEHVTLRNRSALALGQLYLQTGQNEKARDIFRQIELNGIHTNAALLGLGRSYQLLAQHEKAQAAWLELSRQNAFDPAVQHALLLTPALYETMKMPAQAIAAYQQALARYNEQLNAIQQGQHSLNHSKWLQHIKLAPNPVSATSIKEKSKANLDISSLPTALAGHLYLWFASDDFQEAFQDLLTIQKMQKSLELDIKKLKTYQEMIAFYPDRRQHIHQRSQKLLERSQSNLSKAEQLIKNIRSLDKENPQLVSEEEQRALQKLSSLNTHFQALAQHPVLAEDAGQLQAKTNLFMQAIHWKQFQDGPARLSALEGQTEALLSETQHISRAQKKLQQARQALMQRNIFAYSQRNTELLAAYQDFSMQLLKLEQQQKHRLNIVAKAKLETQRQQLNRFVTLSELALVRLEDNSSATKVIKHAPSP